MRNNHKRRGNCVNHISPPQRQVARAIPMGFSLMMYKEIVSSRLTICLAPSWCHWAREQSWRAAWQSRQGGPACPCYILCCPGSAPIHPLWLHCGLQNWLDGCWGVRINTASGASSQMLVLWPQTILPLAILYWLREDEANTFLQSRRSLSILGVAAFAALCGLCVHLPSPLR